MSDKEESVDPGLVKLTARGSCVECKTTYEHQLEVTARFQGIPFFVPKAWAQVVIVVNEPIIPSSAEEFVQGAAEVMSEDMSRSYLNMIQDGSPPFQSVALLCPSCLSGNAGGTPNLWTWFKKDFDMAVHRHVTEEVTKGWVGRVFDFPTKLSSEEDSDA